ncbi:carbamoyltransferase HypF [Coprothermobacteraceae bacterium]|nr:carbamoyltransferase HypF [Coprothermobacteraceae bacterium]
MRKGFNVNGIVQGVGFRPFVARIAQELGLTGFVLNTGTGVQIEVQGDPDLVSVFERKLHREKPSGAFYIYIESAVLPERHDESSFAILQSDRQKELFTFIPPDLATCDECVKETFDRSQRRYLYPFTNCTDCGPRYTVIEALPYDRPKTSMKGFPMCPQCNDEYSNPSDRRYHAQPIACPACGPTTRLIARDGSVTPDPDLTKTARLLEAGKVLAIKGLGGFLLACDAYNESAVRRLRELKRRPKEPFALMALLDTVQEHCEIDEEQLATMNSKACPIVLLKKKRSSSIPDVVAPGQNYLGFMLPYTPLHHILFHHLPKAVLVMTSANLHGDVIYYKDEDIGLVLNLCDYALVHDRPIVTHVDDSVVQFLSDGPHIIRRSRGFVPLPIKLSNAEHPPLLAAGGDEKSTFALAKSGYAVFSQYIGDLENVKAQQTYDKVFHHLRNLFNIDPTLVVVDKHPAYYSRKIGLSLGLHTVEVQHHVAHALSVMEEHRLEEAMALVFDGTGYGDDGTLWGSEAFYVKGFHYERLGHLSYFPLVGGAKAIKSPWRIAAALMPPEEAERRLGPNAREVSELAQAPGFPLACGMGRLFDAVSALLGICTEQTYEGEPAQLLQMAAEKSTETGTFADSISISSGVVQSVEVIRMICELMDRGKNVEDIARLFHNTVIELAVRMLDGASCHNVVLSGGSFQNVLLYEGIRRRLTDMGFQVYRNNVVPMNDNGIALGQIAYVLRRYEHVPWDTDEDTRDQREESDSRVS